MTLVTLPKNTQTHIYILCIRTANAVNKSEIGGTCVVCVLDLASSRLPSTPIYAGCKGGRGTITMVTLKTKIGYANNILRRTARNPFNDDRHRTHVLLIYIYISHLTSNIRNSAKSLCVYMYTIYIMSTL